MPDPDASAVLLDVDGTVVDAVANQRRLWAEWADRFGLDRDEVYALALRTRPADTVAGLLPPVHRADALEHFQSLEDDDVDHGEYTAFAGADRLLRGLEAGRWALVTANLRRRVEGRFRRLGLPVTQVIVEAPIGTSAPFQMRCPTSSPLSHNRQSEECKRLLDLPLDGCGARRKVCAPTTRTTTRSSRPHAGALTFVQQRRPTGFKCSRGCSTPVAFLEDSAAGIVRERATGAQSFQVARVVAKTSSASSVPSNQFMRPEIFHLRSTRLMVQRL